MKSDSQARNEFKAVETARISRSFTSADVRRFAELTGVSNPVHLNEDVVLSSRFKKPIVHGMLCAALPSAVIGTKLPGLGAIFTTQNLRCLLPIAVGETVTPEVEVTGSRRAKRILSLKTHCYNREGRDVIEGDAVILIETVRTEMETT